MTSAVDICNEALATIAARATISSFNDASKEAVNCKIFYNPTRKASASRRSLGVCEEAAIVVGVGKCC
jgi:hypothetical protein